MQRSGGFGAFLFFGADDGWFYGARYLELWSGGEKPQARRPELQGRIFVHRIPQVGGLWVGGLGRMMARKKKKEFNARVAENNRRERDELADGHLKVAATEDWVMAKEDCGICRGTGWKMVARKDGLPGQVAAPCECGMEERAGKVMERARIPKRYEHCDFESYSTDLTDGKTYTAQHESLSSTRNR